MVFPWAALGGGRSSRNVITAAISGKGGVKAFLDSKGPPVLFGIEGFLGGVEGGVSLSCWTPIRIQHPPSRRISRFPTRPLRALCVRCLWPKYQAKRDRRTFLRALAEQILWDPQLFRGGIEMGIGWDLDRDTGGLTVTVHVLVQPRAKPRRGGGDKPVLQ